MLKAGMGANLDFSFDGDDYKVNHWALQKQLGDDNVLTHMPDGTTYLDQFAPDGPDRPDKPDTQIADLQDQIDALLDENDALNQQISSINDQIFSEVLVDIDKLAKFSDDPEMSDILDKVKAALGTDSITLEQLQNFDAEQLGITGDEQWALMDIIVDIANGSTHDMASVVADEDGRKFGQLIAQKGNIQNSIGENNAQINDLRQQIADLRSESSREMYVQNENILNDSENSAEIANFIAQGALSNPETGFISIQFDSETGEAQLFIDGEKSPSLSDKGFNEVSELDTAMAKIMSEIESPVSDSEQELERNTTLAATTLS